MKVHAKFEENEVAERALKSPAAFSEKSEEEQKIVKRESNPRKSSIEVGMWDEAPEFIRDNEYIRKGYRLKLHSWKQVVKSLFVFHNESMNVWTHLCGALLFTFLIIYVGIWVTPRLGFPSYEILKSKLSMHFINGGINDLTIIQNSTIFNEY